MRLFPVAVTGLLALGACNDTDVVGMHIALSASGSGSITTHSLQIPNTPGPAEQGIRRVDWQERVGLFSSRGSFKDITEVRISEIRFQLDGRHLTVTIPRGQGVEWYKTLAPASEEERQRAAKTFDPTGKAKSVGTTVKIEIELPGAAVAVGFFPANVRGVETAKDKNKVTAWLPLRALRQEGDDFRWEVTWM
jgi:hypothetical protein